MRRILYSLLGLVLCFTSAAWAQISFTEVNKISPEIASLWCIPVYDGTDLVVSGESGTGIKMQKYDLDLNTKGGVVTVADTSDTGGEHIADHKHIFQNGFHYITFSISGDGSGGTLYIMKINTALQRQKLIAVTENNPPTNDMLMVGDGTNIHVGKFMPGMGHEIYTFDENLQQIGQPKVIGGGRNMHANGAAALYLNDNFIVLAPSTLAPGMNDDINKLVFDSNWEPVKDRESILYDKGNLSLVTGLVYDSASRNFIVNFQRGTDGGNIGFAVYDLEWTKLYEEDLISGTWHRPHSVIINNDLFLGYDLSGPGSRLARYDYSLPTSDAGAQTACIAHITGNSADWTDTLIVDNIADASTAYTVTLYDASGTSVFKQEFSISGYSYATHELKTLAASAVVGRVSYFDSGLRFRAAYKHEAGGIAEFALSKADASDRLLVFSGHESFIQWKGAAVANMGEAAQDATLYALGNGEILQSVQKNIPAKGKIVGIVDDFFPGLTAAQVEKILVKGATASLSGFSISGSTDSSRLLFTPGLSAEGFSTPSD